MSVASIIEYMTSTGWAMSLPVLEQFQEIVERHLAGDKLSDVEIQAVTDGRVDKANRLDVSAGGVAVIPITGVIAKHARMVNGSSQPRGTSIEWLSGQLQAAVDDPRVSRIFLLIDSPGGSIAGVSEFGRAVYEASFKKPVVAFADDLACSAAVWIGSQATEFWANDTAMVGSVGVYLLMVDSSERAKQDGRRFIIVKSGANKGVGAPGVEITEAQVEVIKERVDGYHEMFLAAILRGRGGRIGAETLRAAADGRTYLAGEAVGMGLIDGVMRLGEALAREVPLRETDMAAAETAMENQKGTIMTETSKTKQGAGGAPGLTQSDVDSAVKADRQRVSAIEAALAGDALADIRKAAIADGTSVSDAKAAAFDAAQTAGAEERKGLQEQIAGHEKRIAAIAKSGDSSLEAGPGGTGDEEEDNDTGDGPDDGKATTFDAAVKAKVAEGTKKAEAFRLAAREYPASHSAWIDAQPQRPASKGRQ